MVVELPTGDGVIAPQSLTDACQSSNHFGLGPLYTGIRVLSKTWRDGHSLRLECINYLPPPCCLRPQELQLEQLAPEIIHRDRARQRLPD